MRDTRYKMPASVRRFGGKEYKYLVIGNKQEAEGDAKRWKDRGFSVRIVKYKTKYAVYIRRG